MKKKKKKRSVHPWRPPSLHCFIAQLAREPVVCIPRGKIGTWCNIFANTVFGKHFDESDNGYIHREGRRFKCSCLGDLYKVYITSFNHNSGCDTIVTMCLCCDV